MGTRDPKDYWVQRPLSEQARKFHLWEGGTLYGMASGVVGSGEAIFFDFGAAGTVVSGDTSGNLYSNLKTAHSGINATYPSRLLIGAGTDVWELGNKFFGSGSPTYSGIYPTYASDVDMLRASRSGWNGVDWEYTVVFLKGSGINQSIFAPLGGPGSKTKGLYTHFSNGPASRAIVDGIPTETTDQEGKEQTRYGLDNFDIFDKYIHYYGKRKGSKNTIRNWNEKAVTRNFKWIFEPSQGFDVYNDKREVWDSGAATTETEIAGCSGCYQQYGGVWPNQNRLRCLPVYNEQECVQAGGYWNPPEIKDTPPISDPPESPPSDDEESDTTGGDDGVPTDPPPAEPDPSPAGEEEKDKCDSVDAKLIDANIPIGKVTEVSIAFNGWIPWGGSMTWYISTGRGTITKNGAIGWAPNITENAYPGTDRPHKASFWIEGLALGTSKILLEGDVECESGDKTRKQLTFEITVVN